MPTSEGILSAIETFGDKWIVVETLRNKVFNELTKRSLNEGILSAKSP